ncbi:MAG: septal ring lytic transglycosylase RlpA family protein, partial [Gammaproteobacteria bacterium]
MTYLAFGQGARTGCLAAALVLAGCVPARWPTQPERGPTPLPPVASSPRPPAPVPGTTTPARKVPSPKPVPSPGPASGNPPFYDVLGERYFVLPSSDGYREQGVASWYGTPFHGRRTSSGVIYDMHGFTAAHKTLPLPSRVRVTNLDTGRSVVVTVNDRGPFVKDRLIDLSFAAAKQIGLLQSGTGRVEVTALDGQLGASPDVTFPATVPVAPT